MKHIILLVLCAVTLILYIAGCASAWFVTSTTTAGCTITSNQYWSQTSTSCISSLCVGIDPYCSASITANWRLGVSQPHTFAIWDAAEGLVVTGVVLFILGVIVLVLEMFVPESPLKPLSPFRPVLVLTALSAVFSFLAITVFGAGLYPAQAADAGSSCSTMNCAFFQSNSGAASGGGPGWIITLVVLFLHIPIIVLLALGFGTVPVAGTGAGTGTGTGAGSGAVNPPSS